MYKNNYLVMSINEQNMTSRKTQNKIHPDEVYIKKMDIAIYP